MSLPSVPPPIPPPIPTNRKRGLGIIIGVVVVLILGALVSAGFYATIKMREAAEKRKASQLVYQELEKSGRDTRNEIADKLESGETFDSGEVMGRMKEQLEKTAAQVPPDEARAMRAMAAVVGRVQAQLAEYEKIVAVLTEKETLAFKVKDREGLATHRQTLSEFLTINEKLTQMVVHYEESIGNALDEAKIPTRAREKIMKDFQRSFHQVGPVQLKIRATDKKLGDTGMAMLDLLEKHWGKWEYTEEGTVFANEAEREAYNVLIDKVNEIAEEQGTLQEELAAKMRALNRR